MIKLVVLYGHPKNPEAFETYYAETHSPLAALVEGVRRFEIGKVLGTPDGGKPPFYRLAELWFDDAGHMTSVLATPAAQKAVADIANFATGGVTMMVAEIG
jgi:uncharacterized protein (TIGR02118 family)